MPPVTTRLHLYVTLTCQYRAMGWLAAPRVDATQRRQSYRVDKLSAVACHENQSVHLHADPPASRWTNE